jgi:predicted AlkP superfamily phosphohydrolase/phosphomutase
MLWAARGFLEQCPERRFNLRSPHRHGPRLLALLLVFVPTAAQAYIGPGAGFALVGSFFVLFTTIVLAMVAIMAWPFRMLIRLLRGRPRVTPLVNRLVILGFDGQDPRITERMVQEGKLPNFRKLSESGCYRRLRTTCPSISPTAWSSFSTGSDPAKHNVYDFLTRDVKTYLPLLSSTHIGSVEKFLRIGPFRIPLRKPELRLLRKSKPSWTVLGEHNIWSTVLRVPITFPPDRFHGAELSAMCVPDLLGTQGTFFLYTTRPSERKFKEGGTRIELKANGSRFETSIQGPENMFRDGQPPMEVPFTVDLDRPAKKACIHIDGVAVELQEKQLSDWITLTFKAAPGIKISGTCRMMITELGEHFSLYISPINIDPENPAMPISHPSYYATYLAKKIGPYCTLGLAEDTWALNEGVIDDATFLRLSWDIDAEREAMFWAAFDRLRHGALFCVFDGTDRIQHMFWRYIDEGHPAARGLDLGPHRNAIEDIYRRNDEIVGKVLARLGKGDELMVLSDHGFASFQRGVNLNAWLLANGYLRLKEGADGASEWLRDVDWSRTKAYVLGLTGMYLNIAGREAEGIVHPGKEVEDLKAELMAKLGGLVDSERGVVGVNEMFDTARLYNGPYLGSAPDFIIGYNAGYRTSWDCATGVIAGPVFEDNVKAWSGDHGIDPRLVPGVFFSTKRIDSDDPALIDIAPTALRLFGIEPPPYMDGKPLV